jgi:hypothetical protein
MPSGYPCISNRAPGEQILDLLLPLHETRANYLVWAYLSGEGDIYCFSEYIHIDIRISICYLEIVAKIPIKIASQFPN